MRELQGHMPAAITARCKSFLAPMEKWVAMVMDAGRTRMLVAETLILGWADALGSWIFTGN